MHESTKPQRCLVECGIIIQVYLNLSFSFFFMIRFLSLNSYPSDKEKKKKQKIHKSFTFKLLSYFAYSVQISLNDD